MKLLRMPEALKNRDIFGFFEDWESNFVTGDRWTPLTSDLTDAATQCLVLASTGVGGILSITQDATDNDETYFGLTKLPFKIAANKPLFAEFRQQYAEVNTNKANVILGWCSTHAANTLIDDGGGPVASGTMAVIYKLDGGTVWRCRSQIGAGVGQTDSVSVQTAGGSATQVLSIEILPYSSTNCKVIYLMDGEPLTDSTGKAITHDLVYTNAVNMGPIFGHKNGSTSQEVLTNDYVAAYQAR